MFRRRIGPRCKGEKCRGDREIERKPNGNAATALKRGGAHGKSFSLKQEKTDSAGIPKFFGTGVMVRGSKRDRMVFRIESDERNGRIVATW